MTWLFTKVCWRRTRRASSARGALCLLAALVLAPGCGRDVSTPAEEEDTGIRRVFERGPVQVVLTLDRKEPSIADRVNFSIEITAQEDYEAELPRFGDKLEQFGIVDYHTLEETLDEDGRVHTGRSYVLEPFLSGEYTIPAMTVTFTKKGEDEAEAHTVETEPITLTVRSLLPEQAAELEIHEICPPVPLPRPKIRWLWPVLGAAAAAAVVLVLVILSRRRPAAAGPTPLPAHEIAYGHLRDLVARDLVGAGQVKLFYQELTDIIRRYIENRFGLHAPEETTEEFLSELGRTDVLPPRHKALLQQFLQHADLVKFAELKPGTADIQKTFDSGKAFIEDTRADRAVTAQAGSNT